MYHKIKGFLFDKAGLLPVLNNKIMCSVVFVTSLNMYCRRDWILRQMQILHSHDCISVMYIYLFIIKDSH